MYFAHYYLLFISYDKFLIVKKLYLNTLNYYKKFIQQNNNYTTCTRSLVEQSCTRHTTCASEIIKYISILTLWFNKIQDTKLLNETNNSVSCDSLFNKSLLVSSSLIKNKSYKILILQIY